MQDDHAYRYYAYITCSLKDKKAAMQLLNKIDSYRIPDEILNDLNAATGLKHPKRIHLLFMDIKDLTPEKTFPRDLEDSKFLIVICSPNGAKSEWVNHDVENFILMGRYDRIIPYIIEGVPNSGDPETECFPPILRKNREFISYSHLTPEENAERHAKLHAALDDIQDELKGVSQSGDGVKAARLKVIARMLEVNPDMALVHNKLDRLQRRTKKIFWLSITTLFFMLFFIGLRIWAWDRYSRVHTDYFADYVECWGAPKGIFPLSAQQRKHRHEHYRIYTQNQKVIRLERVNSVGTPVPIENSEFQDRPMIAVYCYSIDGRLTQRDSLDKNGKVVLSYVYSGDRMQKVEFGSIDSNGCVIPKPIANATLITNNHSLLENGKSGEIGNMLLIRDPEGRVIEERFQKGIYDVPAADEQGIAGFQYKRDEYGRVIEKQYLALDGSLIQDKHGVARRTNRYDENGNLVEAEYFDQNGNLTPNELGWMHCIRAFDKYGNLVEEKYVDASGKLSPSNALAAKFFCSYDAMGNIIEQVFFGIDGKPCLNKDGYNKVLRKYDEQGKLINEAFFSLDGYIEAH